MSTVLNHPARMWEITISSPPTFKTLTNVLDAIFTQVVFRIVQTPDFTGLRVDDLNGPQTCLLRCQYECEVAQFGGFEAHDHAFCIPSNILSAILRTVSENHVLKLVGYEYNAPQVTVLTYAVDNVVNATQSVINVIDQPISTYSAVVFAAKKVVDLDVLSLKNMIKSAKDLRSPYIKLSICTPVSAADDDYVDNFFTIGVEGDAASLNRTFHSRTPREMENSNFENVESKSQGGVADDAADPDTKDNASSSGYATSYFLPHVAGAFGELKTVFCEAYSTQLLSDVVRHMEKGNVQLFMCPDMPLYLKHDIAQNSHVVSLFTGCVV